MIRPYRGRFRTSCLLRQDPPSGQVHAGLQSPTRSAAAGADVLLVYPRTGRLYNKIRGKLCYMLQSARIVGRSRWQGSPRGMSDETSCITLGRQTIRPPAEPLDVSGHDLGNYALKVQQIL